MGAWFAKLWQDEAYFWHAANSGMRFAMIGTGWLLESGAIPTGVDNGGKHLGPVLILLSAFAGRAKRLPTE